MQKNADKIIEARFVLPLESADNNAFLDNHSVVIADGTIAAILPWEEARAQYDAKETVTCHQHAILPGLINAHTHVPMNLIRGIADDLKLMDWLQNHIWPTEQKWLSESFVADGARLALAELIKGGTTCFNDMYPFPNMVAKVADEVGIRARVGITVMTVPTPWAQTEKEYIEKGTEVVEAYNNHPLVQFTFSPHSVYAVTPESLTEMRDLSERYRVPLHIHVQETADEVNQSLAATKQRPMKRLWDLGLITARTMAVHMTQIVEEDIELLVKAKANVVHCPESNMKLASGYCPLSKLKASGVNVALGTDSVSSNNDLDMFGEMRSASLLAKMMDGDPESLPAAETLQMATLCGAKALGLDDKIGTLTVGKSADMIAVSLATLNTLPVYNPISQLVYAAGRDSVTHSWVAGKALMENRRLTTLDETALLANAESWANKIKAGK